MEQLDAVAAEQEVPELSSYSHTGPNDVRDILVRQGEFLVATGRGIFRYRLGTDSAEVFAAYSTASGLPSDNAFLLREDAAGGTWALCEGGVGYLAKGSDNWVAFTARSGLAPGSVTYLAVSPNGRRVWVASTGGLATLSAGQGQWRAYPARNPVSIFLAPDGTKAWCQRVLASACACGRRALISQFDLITETWRDIPGSGKCAHVAPETAFFCQTTQRLWIGGTYAPPLLYDPASGKTTTWPAQPNWETVVNGNTGTYWDWFGQMLPFADGTGRMWFATNAGLWIYDPRNDTWEIRRFSSSPGCGNPMLTRTCDGRTIYWANEGTVAAFDVRSRKWTELWKPEGYFGRGQGRQLVLSPDEQCLWQVIEEGIVVVDLRTRGSACLKDKTSPGLGSPCMVRFDARAGRAIVGTNRGIAICDYAGKVLSRTAPSSCPITYPVVRFVFAPDGSEVWCRQKDSGGFERAAVVLYPKERRWEEVPDPAAERRFHDVIFSKDGRTTWLAMNITVLDPNGFLERTRDDRRWVPVRGRMPKYYGEIESFRLNPRGDELWLRTDGWGLLRIKLAKWDVSHYTKSESRTEGIEKRFGLVADHVQDLIFTSDGRYLICSANFGRDQGLSLIDMRDGNSQGFPTKAYVRRLSLGADQKTVSCELDTGDSPLFFDIEHRRWIPGGKPGPPLMPPPPAPAGANRFLDSLTVEAAEAGLEVVGSSEPLDGRYCVCVVASPEGRRSIRVFDARARSLTSVKEIGSAEVTAMQVGPGGVVWVALPACITSVDPRTRKVSLFD